MQIHIFQVHPETKVWEIEHRVLHEHPLTLSENKGEGELFCPGCGVLDQSYNCKRCQFSPLICFACQTIPSVVSIFANYAALNLLCFINHVLNLRKTSKSPFTHIALYFEGECSSSNRLGHCHFCN